MNRLCADCARECFNSNRLFAHFSRPRAMNLPQHLPHLLQQLWGVGPLPLDTALCHWPPNLRYTAPNLQIYVELHMNCRKIQRRIPNTLCFLSDSLKYIVTAYKFDYHNSGPINYQSSILYNNSFDVVGHIFSISNKSRTTSRRNRMPCRERKFFEIF